jgi:O-antigen/teichoic acid export membrane protein
MAESDLLDRPEAGARLIRGSTVRAFTTGGSLFCNALAVAATIRYLGSDSYGDLTRLAALVFICTVLVDAGVTGLATREYAVAPHVERAPILRSFLGLRLVSIAVAAVLVVAVAAASGESAFLLRGAVLLVAGAGVTVLQQTYAVPLANSLRIQTVAFLELLRNVIALGLTIVLVEASAGILWFFAVPAASGIAMLAVTLVLVRGSGGLVPSLDLPRWRATLRPAVPYAVAAAAGVVYFRFPMWIIGDVSSVEQTGQFAIAFRAVEALTAIPILVVASAWPLLARSASVDRARLTHVLGRASEVALVIGTGIALVLALGAPLIVLLLSGGEPRAAVEALRVLSVALITTFLTTSWSFALLSLHRYRSLMIATGIASIAAAGGSALLAASFGAVGAAVSVVVAEGVLVTGYALALQRTTSVPVPWVVAAKVVGAVCIAVIPAALGAPPIISAPVGVAVYASLVVAFRAVPGEVWVALSLRRPRPAGGA